MRRLEYIALLHKDADSDYGVSFPDLPGCTSAGATLDEAREGASEALALHLDGMAEDGEPVPEPSSLEAIMADASHRDGVAVLIAAPATSRAVRVNITMAADLLDRVDAYATLHGLNRSGLLARAALDYIEAPLAIAPALEPDRKPRAKSKAQRNVA